MTSFQAKVKGHKDVYEVLDKNRWDLSYKKGTLAEHEALRQLGYKFEVVEVINPRYTFLKAYK